MILDIYKLKEERFILVQILQRFQSIVCWPYGRPNGMVVGQSRGERAYHMAAGGRAASGKEGESYVLSGYSHSDPPPPQGLTSLFTFSYKLISRLIHWCAQAP